MKVNETRAPLARRRGVRRRPTAFAVRVGARPMGPERWWTMLEEGEARGNSGGGPSRFWRANRSSHLSIGAKDSSNRLVAGSLRNFPQDSWHSVGAVSSGKANDCALSFGADVPPRRILKLGIGEGGAPARDHLWCGRTMRAVLSGPFLVSRTGDAGWTERGAKVPESTLIRSHERCRSLQTAGRWPRKSAPAKECVTTHLPKRPALKMEGAQASHPCPAAAPPPFGREVFSRVRAASRRARRSPWRRSAREPGRNGRRCRSWW